MLREGFRELDADILTLQETILSDDRTRPARCSARSTTWPSSTPRERRTGITTASRWPFERLMTFTWRTRTA